jgi:hypothetical protein
MQLIRREVELLLKAGQSCSVPKTEGTCREILTRRQMLWTFMRYEGMEPTILPSPSTFENSMCPAA